MTGLCLVIRTFQALLLSTVVGIAGMRLLLLIATQLSFPYVSSLSTMFGISFIAM